MAELLQKTPSYQTATTSRMLTYVINLYSKIVDLKKSPLHIILHILINVGSNIDIVNQMTLSNLETAMCIEYHIVYLNWDSNVHMNSYSREILAFTLSCFKRC